MYEREQLSAELLSVVNIVDKGIRMRMHRGVVGGDRYLSELLFSIRNQSLFPGGGK
jgi:hypothetical protein